MYEFLTALGHITWGILSLVFWVTIILLIVIEVTDNYKKRKQRKLFNEMFDDEENY